MYGFFILALIATFILIFAILWSTLPHRLSNHYDRKLGYTNPKTGQWSEFFNSHYQIETLSKHDQALLGHLQKNYKKYKFWNRIKNSCETFKVLLIVICGVLIFVSLLASLVCLTGAKQEVAYWEEFAPMAEEVVGEADEYQSIAIADKVIEYNTWLAKAKSSKKTWGIWSEFYYSDLSDLEYITLNSGGK